MTYSTTNHPGDAGDDTPPNAFDHFDEFEHTDAAYDDADYDDAAYDSAHDHAESEGPAQSATRAFDEDEYADALDEADDYADEHDEFAEDEFHDEYDEDYADQPVAAFDGQGSELADSAWSLFEDEIANALDADSTDEFLSSVLGGFSNIASRLARGGARAARGAGRIGRHAQTAGRYAGYAGRMAQAGSMLARYLGHRGLAQQLQRYGHIAHGAGRVANTAGGALQQASQMPRHLRSAASVTRRAAAHSNPLSELLSQIGKLNENDADDFEAFDAMADLYEDGVDAALPAAVGLAARLAARALGDRALGQLNPQARRAFVRGIASAARHLVQGAGPQGARALPRVAASGARAARAQRSSPNQLPIRVARNAARAAQQVVRRPQVRRRMARPLSQTRPPARAGSRHGRPAAVGRGVPSITRGSARRYVLDGPVELTIRPL